VCLDEVIHIAQCDRVSLSTVIFDNEYWRYTAAFDDLGGWE
jgi:hypothetical protein